MTALTTNTPTRLVLAPGRLYTNTNVLAGVTEGPISVEIERQVRQVPAEGVLQPVQGLEYITSEIIRISCALKELSEANIQSFHNNGAAATGTAPNLIWTSPQNLQLLATSTYLTNVQVLSARPSGSVVGYKIPVAMVTSCVMQTPAAPGEAVLQVTLESRATLAAPNGKTFELIAAAGFP